MGEFWVTESGRRTRLFAGRTIDLLTEQIQMNTTHTLIRAARNVLIGWVCATFLSIPAQAQSQAESLSASFRKAAQRVSPALVGIRSMSPTRPFTVPIPSIGPFRPGDFIPSVVPPIAIPEFESNGSGFMIDSDRGYVVTTDGVLLGSSQAMVIFSDGTERVASQIRRDQRSELVLLIVDVKGLNLSAATWGDANALEPGDWVLGLGVARGAPPSLSAGIFSTRRAGSAQHSGEEWLETDIRPSPAISGGPVVNLKGEVVGIDSGFPGRRDTPAGRNYVLPSARVRRIVTELADFGQVRRAYLGVDIEPSAFLPGRPPGQGTLVISGVRPNTPAAAAGLRGGDRIMSVNGKPLLSLGQLQSAVEGAPIGEELTLMVERGGKRIEVKVRPQAQPVPGGPGGGVRSRIEPEQEPGAARGRARGRQRAGQSDPAAPPVKPPDPETPELDPIPKS
jgi:serine protease Do